MLCTVNAASCCAHYDTDCNTRYVNALCDQMCETQVSRLAAELETTRRRVKALEKHMIKKKSSQSSLLTALPASSELE
jgi:Mg2+ and Co2+ transporter CorA